MAPQLDYMSSSELDLAAISQTFDVLRGASREFRFDALLMSTLNLT